MNQLRQSLPTGDIYGLIKDPKNEEERHLGQVANEAFALEGVKVEEDEKDDVFIDGFVSQFMLLTSCAIFTHYKEVCKFIHQLNVQKRWSLMYAKPGCLLCTMSIQ